MKKFITVLIVAFLLIGLSYAGPDHSDRKAGPSKDLSQIAESKCINIMGAENPETIVEMILGPGISYTNVTAQGVFSLDPSVASIGYFTGGDCVPLGFDEGVILSSGTVGNAVGPNEWDDTSADLDLPGDPDLDALIPGYMTYDASWVEFDFIPEDNQIFIQYVFGSEEYNEFVDSDYNDVFAFFVNGENIALIPGTTIPVSINNVNNGFAWEGHAATGPCNNCDFYRDNADLTNPPYNIECDGMTTVLTASAPVTPGEVNTIKIAIADAGDPYYDSWVFIKTDSFSIIDPHLQISPKFGSSHLYLEKCWEVLYLDQYNSPVEDAEINWTVAGPNSHYSGSAFTNEHGIATFCYTGIYAGTDIITASVDDLSVSAFFVWFDPPQPVSAVIGLDNPSVQGIYKWTYGAAGSKCQNMERPEFKVTQEGKNPWTWQRLISDLKAKKIIAADISGNGSLELIIHFDDNILGYYSFASGTWEVIRHDCIDFTVAQANIDMQKQVIFSIQEGTYILNFPTFTLTRLFQVPAEVMTASDIMRNGLDELIVTFNGLNNLYAYSFITGSSTVLARSKPSQMLTGDLTGNGYDELICAFEGFGIYMFKFFDEKSFISKSNPWQIERITYADPMPGHNMATGNIAFGNADELILSMIGRTYYYSYSSKGWTTLTHAPMKTIFAGNFTGQAKDDLITCLSLNNNIYLKPSSGIWQLMVNNGNSNAMASLE